MPISRKRKKNGKKVKKGTLTIDPNKESSVTLQDLINVLAYQEYVKDGTIIADDAKINVPVELPVTVIDEDGNKRRVGTATTIPGDDNEVAFHIDDPDFEPMFHDGKPNFSIDKENTE